jgi:hypothetical protein
MGSDMESGPPVEIKFIIWKHAEGDKAKWDAHKRRSEELHKLVNDLGLDVTDWGVTDDTLRHHESTPLKTRYKAPSKYLDTISRMKNLVKKDVAEGIRISKIGVNEEIEIINASEEDFLKLYQAI